MVKLRTLKQSGIYFSSLALVLFFFTGMQQLSGQSITDFESKKPIKVADATGQSTIQRALPFKIVDGDQYTEGTGTIELDWTHISDKTDIAVYDELGNLLDYYFEVFDATDKVAVIWVYNDWKRDGTAQAQIGFGNGLSDQSASKATVFGNESNLVAGYLLNEQSGDALDVTGNNDGTVYGATQGQAGQVGKAYTFDGHMDRIDLGTISSGNPLMLNGSDVTISAWVNFESTGDDWQRIFSKASSNNAQNGYELGIHTNNEVYVWSNGKYVNGGSVPEKTWTHIVAIWYENEDKTDIFINNQKTELGSLPSIPNAETGARIGTWYNPGQRDFDGKIDDIRVYGKALTTNEVEAIYDATKSSPTFFYQMAAMDSDDEILPVQLLSFRATCLEGNRAEISWQTATELNNQQFEVQLSANGQHFETVRTIPGAGNSNEVLTYETVINISGDHGYVRLKQMDFDGQTETFNPVELVCKEQNKQISIFPNPITDNMNIDLSGYSQYDMNIQVLNIMGKVVHATEVQSGTQQVQINVEALPPGMYMVRIQNNNGEQTLKRITK